jgi:molybdate transport system permease protein
VTPDELQAISLSLGVAAAATAIDLPLALLFGTWFARHRGPGTTFVEAIVMAPLVVPPVVTGYGLLLLFGNHVAFTTLAAVLAGAVVALPLFVRAVRQAIEAVDPSLEDAACSLGATRGRVFRTITLPLARSGVLAGAVLAFARALGEFGATAVFAGSIAGRTRTIPLAIHAKLQTLDGDASAFRLAAAAFALSVVAMLASEWLARRHA